MERRSAAPTRIDLFSFNYPPADGGISRLCAELVCGLGRKGVEIQVLSQRERKPGSDVPDVAEERVTARRPWRELAAVRALSRRGPRRAVVCGRWYPEGLLAMLAGARPLVILAHGLELRPTREQWRRGAWRRLRRLVLGRADLVVANSRYTARLVSEAAPGARVEALLLGVDHRRFSPGDRPSARRRLAVPEDKRVVLTVSRILEHKGHRTVLRALAALPEDDRTQLVYLIAGRGRDMDALRQEAEAQGLGEVVRWLGYVAEADLPDLYRSADLFVLCTREDPGRSEVEGFGLALLEAQACGTPVVGSRTGGIPDAVLEGTGGWLVDQDDVAAIAATLARLVRRPEDFRAMGSAARRRVEDEGTWDQYADRFLASLRP